MVFHERKWLVRLATQTTAQIPFLELITIFWYLAKVLTCGLPILVTQSTTMKVLKGQHSAKLIIFTT